MDNTERICCICGKKFVGWGNNPYPVVKDPEARCCDDCNTIHVITARLNQMYMEKDDGKR